MQFAAPAPPAADAAASSPAWLRHALAPEAATHKPEWEAALDGLTLFFIGGLDCSGRFPPLKKATHPPNKGLRKHEAFLTLP